MAWNRTNDWILDWIEREVEGFYEVRNEQFTVRDVMNPKCCRQHVVKTRDRLIHMMRTHIGKPRRYGTYDMFADGTPADYLPMSLLDIAHCFWMHHSSVIASLKRTRNYKADSPTFTPPEPNPTQTA